eukprot:73601_1
MILFLCLLQAFGGAVSEYFVSKNGSSHNNCGSWDDACGSLYGVSLRIIQNNSFNDENTLIIIDGQNNEEIIRYKNNKTNGNHNPCLPLPFDYNMKINILFNTSTINKMNDWFPQTICNDTDNTYSNEYMFDGANELTINNLIINDYPILSTTHNLEGIMRSLYFDAIIKCNYCKFINIESTNDNPLFHSMSSIIFVDNQFINISKPNGGNIIFADHSLDMDDAVRLFIINRTIFVNVITVESFLNIARSSNDFNNGATLRINNCIFDNVSTQSDIIYDGAWFNDVIISDTIINNIFSGSVYYSNHAVLSDVNIYNITISTNQLSNTQINRNALFSFSSSDVTHVDTLTIYYSINTNTSCKYLTTTYNSVINASCLEWRCNNPIAFINNRGFITIDYSIIDIDIDIVSHNDIIYNQYQYEYANDGALMLNYNKMKINNMLIHKLICYSLIYNEGNLAVFNLSYETNDISTRFDPNSLHSTSIIYQSGSESALFVHYSLFSNSYSQIYIDGGSAEIFYSIFQDGNVAIYVDHANKFVMSECDIINNGPYNGPFISDEYSVIYHTKSMIIINSEDILISNNNYFGFSPD